jgi:hypothetical protein
LSGTNRTIRRRIQWGALAGVGVLGLGLGIVHIAAPPNASAASGVQRVTASSARNLNAKTLTVLCPVGTTATGGFATTDAPAGVHVDRIWPTGRTVEIHATPLPTVSTSWRISGGAICTTATSDIQYVQSAAKTASKASDDDRRYGVVTFADCPNGKELIGFGGTAIGARLKHVQPVGPGVPYTGDSSTRPIHGASVLASAYAAGSSTATVRAIAVCANVGHGSMVPVKEVHDKTAFKSLGITCPAGKQLHAIGGLMFYPNHYAEKTNFSFALFESFSSASATTGGTSARRRPDNIPVEDWGLVTYGLCAIS